MNKLSKRLQEIYDLVINCDSLVEIGCDHCWLSIHLIQGQKANKIIASDINAKPLETCKRNIRETGQLNIQTVLSDGFKSINQNFQCAIIAGMGGKLIINIINEIKNINNIQLVLQPQKNEGLIREFIKEKKLKINDEKLVKDGEFIYTIISVDKSGVGLKDDVDIFIGPKLRYNKEKIAINKFTKRLNHLSQFINKINDQNKKIHISREIKAIELYLEKKYESKWNCKGIV